MNCSCRLYGADFPNMNLAIGSRVCNCVFQALLHAAKFGHDDGGRIIWRKMPSPLHLWIVRECRRGRRWTPVPGGPGDDDRRNRLGPSMPPCRAICASAFSR